ncbi:PEP-CTERM sorting domain-containing protein [Aquabacterium sp.]|uniref:PEP-CTERM sorting domain-containing protein n=1 Tax=Aquabacterium sp. TaxID=1872578 RepID=UPI0024891B82|nr:PEP-CTERM sorting domain-containing protein [Aquabacterium sp.]MDI1259539.1 PEP-CTERM sorting domain-containing protein [Aquabacterium sp.]
MTPAFALRSLALVWLGASAAAQAAPTHLTAGQVDIDFDTDSFTWERSVQASGGVVYEALPLSSFTLTPVANGFEVNFNDLMAVQASSHVNASPVTLTGAFSSVFNFTPAAGHVITGYTVTYSGMYSIDDPGFVSLRGPGYGFNGYALSGPIDYVGSEAASGAFRLDLSISAFADVVTRPVFDGHETDLGEASINVRTVMVQANVAVVPEPSGQRLWLAGLSLVGWRMWRRRG